MAIKRLGQHFLKDESVLRKTADILEIGQDETVVEIGPGHGELTKYLLQKNPRRIIALEKDPKLAGSLYKNLGLGENDPRLEVITGDALELLPELLKKGGLGEKYKIAGNIPYYITGYLLRIVSELEPKPRLVALVIQKEVAERLSALPPRMNLLSASTRFWSEPEIIRRIGAKSFSPPPKVDSALVLFKTLDKRPDIDPAAYYSFIRKLFKQPRKTIFNNISAGGTQEERGETKTKLAALGIELNQRPETLGIEEITGLAREFPEIR